MRTLRLEVSLLLLHFWNCAFNCNGATLTIFKEEKFQGEKYDADTYTNCTKIPPEFRIGNGSLLTSGCVAVFFDESCQVEYYAFVVPAQEKSIARVKAALNLSEPTPRYGISVETSIQAYRDCKDLEGSPFPNLEYHASKGLGHLEPVSEKDICGCTESVSSFGFESGVHTHGNCFNFYQAPKCTGEPTVVESIGWYSSTRLRSFEPCQIPFACGNLKAKAFNLEPALDIESFGGIIKNVAIDVKQTFINDGPGTMEESYEVERKLVETATFKFSKSLRNLVSSSNSIKTSWENGTQEKMEAGMNLGVSTPQVGNVGASAMASVKVSKTLTERLQQGVENEFQKENERSKTDASANGISTEKSFRVEKTITIQPCTSYEVSSFVKMAENLEIDYYMHFEISGFTKSGIRMTKEDLRLGLERQTGSEEGLKILHGHPRENNVTIVAQNHIKLIANYGMNSVVTGVGEPLEECQQKIELCNCCNAEKTDAAESDSEETDLDATGPEETESEETEHDADTEGNNV